MPSGLSSKGLGNSGNGPGSSEKPKIVDILRLSDLQLIELFRQLKRPEKNPEGGDRRCEERVPFPSPKRLVISIDEPAGEPGIYLVIGRDMSPHGIAFLHGKFAYPETRFTIRLITLDDEAVLVAGRVRRCFHVQGRIHEVGARFDQPIELSDFLPTSRY